MHTPKPRLLKHRHRILRLLDEATDCMTARDIATSLGIPYKTTIDALNTLYNDERVHRIGRKSSAKWAAAKIQVRPDTLDPLTFICKWIER